MLESDEEEEAVRGTNPATLEQTQPLHTILRRRSRLRRNVRRFRGGLVSKALRLLYHSTLGSRGMKQKERIRSLKLPPEPIRDVLEGVLRLMNNQVLPHMTL